MTTYHQAMEEENLSFFLPAPETSDLDHSFTSTTSTSSFATASSARSSLSLSLPSFSAVSSSKPLPHAASDPHWSALRAASALGSPLTLRHLKILRHLGSGHLARVFHCRLRGFESSAAADFALKVVDLDVLTPDQLSHVRTEAQVLAALDHPFLPSLYARLDASHYACFLIDFCPAGDLHSLLRRRRLPPPAARFYAAEVLLALQYLHALGFVYRDLKPENVLLRSDGHVMLSDFDLCFQSQVSPSLRRHRRRRRKTTLSCCFRPSFSADSDEEIEFVAEPDAAFSRECVGTHEYLAPEMVAGVGHGSGVDWWAFGIFLYELMYGQTPFKGLTKEATLRNINDHHSSVRFPARGSPAGNDLISRLLVRDPKLRLGADGGAAEIMRHPFFDGVDWPLIRCSKPPIAVGPARRGVKLEKRRLDKKLGRWIKLGLGRRVG